MRSCESTLSLVLASLLCLSCATARALPAVAVPQKPLGPPLTDEEADIFSAALRAIIHGHPASSVVVVDPHVGSDSLFTSVFVPPDDVLPDLPHDLTTDFNTQNRTERLLALPLDLQNPYRLLTARQLTEAFGCPPTIKGADVLLVSLSSPGFNAARDRAVLWVRFGSMEYYVLATADSGRWAVTLTWFRHSSWFWRCRPR